MTDYPTIKLLKDLETVQSLLSALVLPPAINTMEVLERSRRRWSARTPATPVLLLRVNNGDGCLRSVSMAAVTGDQPSLKPETIPPSALKLRGIWSIHTAVEEGCSVKGRHAGMRFLVLCDVWQVKTSERKAVCCRLTFLWSHHVIFFSSGIGLKLFFWIRNASRAFFPSLHPHAAATSRIYTTHCRLMCF